MGGNKNTQQISTFARYLDVLTNSVEVTSVYNRFNNPTEFGKRTIVRRAGRYPDKVLVDVELNSEIIRASFQIIQAIRIH